FEARAVYRVLKAAKKRLGIFFLRRGTFYYRLSLYIVVEARRSSKNWAEGFCCELPGRKASVDQVCRVTCPCRLACAVQLSRKGENFCVKPGSILAGQLAGRNSTPSRP